MDRYRKYTLNKIIKIKNCKQLTEETVYIHLHIFQTQSLKMRLNVLDMEHRFNFS